MRSFTPVRFSIMAGLAVADATEFAFVGNTVEVSDLVLSRQVSTLELAGYVKVRKGYAGKRPRTWFSLTRTGRAAFQAHLGTLREITGRDHPQAGERPSLTGWLLATARWPHPRHRVLAWAAGGEEYRLRAIVIPKAAVNLRNQRAALRLLGLDVPADDIHDHLVRRAAPAFTGRAS
jgi:DNA-binding MarR family transcriptional regulator